MLKTEQILNAKFTPVSKGTYNAEEVDAFLRVVAQSYDALNNEKSELIKKISILADKIESYRNDEEAIKLSLLDAHRMAETINKNATIKSETLIGDAETRAQLIVDGANRQSTKAIEEAKEQAKEIVENAKNAVATLTERAQNESDATLSSAKEKAASIISDAEAEAKKIVGSSKAAYDFYSAELVRIQDAFAEYKSTVSSICKEQLVLIDSIPETITVPLAYENVAEEEQEIIVSDDEEIKVDSENIFAELDEEIAAIENADEKVEFNEIPEQDVSVEEISDDNEVENIEIESAVEETTDDSDNFDDIFSLIDDIDLDNIDTDSIPESLDDLVVSVDEPAENNAEEEIEETTEELVIESEDDETEEDAFDGFKIDLDSLGFEESEEEDDITSLFDSMFDE